MDLRKTVKSNITGISFGVRCVAPKSNAFNGDLPLKSIVLALLLEHFFANHKNDLWKTVCFGGCVLQLSVIRL